MNKTKVFWSIFFLFFLSYCFSQKLYFKKIELENPEFKNKLLVLNKQLIKIYKDKDSEKYADNYFRLQMLNDDYDGALNTINEIRRTYQESYPYYSKILGIQFELYLLAKKQTKSDDIRLVYEKLLRDKYQKLPIQSKQLISESFEFKKDFSKNVVIKILKDSIIEDSILVKDAVLLCRHYNTYMTIEKTFSIAKPLLKKLDDEEFLVKDSIIVKTKSNKEISLYYVLNKKINKKEATILHFTTYMPKDDYHISQSKIDADRGYNIVHAYSRGVYLSKDQISPFEFEVEDVNEVIDWIIKQLWSNGKVGMIGGSYDGFSQWAAAKNLHPALKTIIPSASVGFGIDFPMENNVFNTYMIRWLENVIKGRHIPYKDSNTDKWKNLVNKLYNRGVSFKNLDSLNGNSNLIFQRWLQHPSFDTFWQSKIPYKKDFAKINIPVLTFTGYFDDDQRGAMYYYDEHHKYNKNANHYLIIGPYDHFGAQGYIKNNLRGYTIDSIAKIDIEEISYQWFNYVLKGKKKPEFLKDKVNYQLMGSNQWKSIPSIDKISNIKLKLFLNNTKLQESKTNLDYIFQKIDFQDRKDTLQNFDRYKILDSIIDPRILKDKLIFESQIFKDSFELNGSFTGNIKISINKKDIDITIKLYELMANGKYFLLSNYLARASYAKDRRVRQFLTPNKEEGIPIYNTYFISKKIEKGSKLIVVLGANKTPFEQINYGTGKDVSTETILDGKEPLEIKWYNDSYIEFPVLR